MINSVTHSPSFKAWHKITQPEKKEPTISKAERDALLALDYCIGGFTAPLLREVRYNM